MEGKSLIIRAGDLKKEVGIARSTVYYLEKEGKFPKRRKISAGISGWLRSEVEEWLKNREAA